MKTSFVAIALFSLVATAYANTCPDNEAVPNCFRYEESCQDKDAFVMDVCMPTDKCQCIVGYNRNAVGDCVPKDQCEPKCPANEHMRGCKRLNEQCKDKKRMITSMICIPNKKCTCNNNLFRDSKGACVPKEECDDEVRAKRSVAASSTVKPSTCAADEYVPACSRFNENCNMRNVRIFPMVCLPTNKCTCREGLFRNKAGKCVRKETCELDDVSTTVSPKTCPRNEYVAACKRCDETCQFKDVRCPRLCVPNTECTCLPGFNRNRFGSCVNKAQC